MKIFFSPQVADDVIEYKFKDEKIYVTINEVTETFDFTGVPNGRLQIVDPESGDFLLENNLPVNPIISAKKKDGVLYIELLNWISEDASESERFPEWIDANNYQPPAKPEPSPEPGEESESEENPLENWGEF